MQGLKFFILTALFLAISGCMTLSLISPSVSYNNNYAAGSNPNQIFCTPGTFFKAAYCTIPLSRFIAISSHNADLMESSTLITYAKTHNNAFIFDDITKNTTLTELNNHIQESLLQTKFQQPPLEVSKLYTKLTTVYIPEQNQLKQADTYIYLLTLNTLRFATDPCPVAFAENESANATPAAIQQLMIYKVFSVRFTNAVLMHIADSVDGKYDNETEMFDGVYAAILDLKPEQLRSLAIKAYQSTLQTAPKYNPDFLTPGGIRFAKVGNFSCTKEGTEWLRYGFEFFGLNISGVRNVVKFKTPDIYSNTDADRLMINND